MDEAVKKWGRLDTLHYNVGVSLGGGDKSPLEITEEAFDKVNAINLRGFIMACKHALPIMREQRSGSILSISSQRSCLRVRSPSMQSRSIAWCWPLPSRSQG